MLGNDEEGCKSKIGNSHGVSNKPVTSEGGVNGFSVSLHFVEGGREVSLKNVTPSVDGMNCGHLVGDELGYTPEAPLVDLCSLNSVSAEQSWVAVSEVLSNGD